MLAMRRSSWAHSSGFTTSVETHESSQRVSKKDVKKAETTSVKEVHKVKDVSLHIEEMEKCHVQFVLKTA